MILWSWEILWAFHTAQQSPQNKGLLNMYGFQFGLLLSLEPLKHIPQGLCLFMIRPSIWTWFWLNRWSLNVMQHFHSSYLAIAVLGKHNSNCWTSLMDEEQKVGLFSGSLTFGSNVCNTNENAITNSSLPFLIVGIFHCVGKVDDYIFFFVSFLMLEC